MNFSQSKQIYNTFFLNQRYWNETYIFEIEERNRISRQDKFESDDRTLKNPVSCWYLMPINIVILQKTLHYIKLWYRIEVTMKQQIYNFANIFCYVLYEYMCILQKIGCSLRKFFFFTNMIYWRNIITSGK